MGLFKGVLYNIKGIWMGLKTPKLLLLGVARFIITLVITISFMSVIYIYHQDILNLIVSKPTSSWFVWLWYILSFVVSLVLMAISTIVAYLISQLFFSVFIMEAMSQITEKMVTQEVLNPEKKGFFHQFFYLVKQEIPRTILPLIFLLFLMVFGWLTPFGSVITIVNTIISAIFLAWDYTDLTPARRLVPFKTRFQFVRQNLFFHLGFGLLFLIPFVNILFLSFAPVGATLYYLEKNPTLVA